MGWRPDDKSSGRSQSDVYFEFISVGPQVRVAAIDAKSGIEVVVIAPASATQVQMQNLALAKLKRRLGQGE
jgi:hypothetical protein